MARPRRWRPDTPGRVVNPDDGPLDPFLGDPDDPAAVLADPDPIEPLNDEERADVMADLRELAQFRGALETRGVCGIAVECADCGEQHYFGWELMAANLRALLGQGRTHIHEPAFDPQHDSYVSWDYARGYTDATHGAIRPR
ncbi:MAG: DUF5319 domain-containing protein [Actinomycetota bacterium]